jgi:hypothetical protein
MARFRRYGVYLSTLMTGAAFGLVVTALVSPILPGATQPGDRHEPPETRGYILALLASDGAAINRLQLPRNVVDRAAVLKSFEQALNLPGHTLTYLGGNRTGRLGQFGYVLTVNTPNGGFDSIPLLVTTLGDRVWYLRGGSTGRPVQAAPSVAPSAPAASAPAPSASAS